LDAQRLKQLFFGNIVLLNQDIPDAPAFILAQASGFGQILFIQVVLIDQYIG
jgi:hypothetical protein